MNLKQKLLKNSTNKILSDLDSMNLEKIQRMQIKNFVLLFRDSFSIESVKHSTFFLDIGNDYKLFPYDSYGFCKATSVSHIGLLGDLDWQLMYIDDTWKYGPHYYLMHKKTKKILDYTFDQYIFDGVEIPYEMGRQVKIDQQSKDTAVRFTHSVGLDFTKLFSKKEDR